MPWLIVNEKQHLATPADSLIRRVCLMGSASVLEGGEGRACFAAFLTVEVEKKFFLNFFITDQFL